MFCEKCGAKLPENGRFCEACGAPVPVAAPAAPAENQAAVPPQPQPPYQPQPQYQPQPAYYAPKKPSFFSNKRNLYIVIGIAAALVVAIVALIVVLSLPTTVNLDDYFTVTYSGYDGYGSARVEWDEEALQKINKKIFGDKKKNSSGNVWEDLENALTSQFSLKYFVSISLDQEAGALSNGDTVSVSYEAIEGFEEKYDVKLKLRKDTYTVSDLTPVLSIDPLAGIEFSFTGYNGYGNAAVAVKEEYVTVEGSSYTLRYNDRYNGLSVQVMNEDGYSEYSLYYRFDRYEELSNGDVLALTMEEGYYNAEDMAERTGLSLSSEETSVTVEGLTALTEFDPFSNVTLGFEGYNTLGVMNGTFASKTITVGEYTVTYSMDGSSYRFRYYVTFGNEEDEDLYSFYYTADKFEDLSNGDTITFSSYVDKEYFERVYGITVTTPDEPTYTVSGLTPPVEPAIFDHLSIGFSGYEGYGVISMTAKDEVYTVGNYTFKLTPTLVTDGWSKSCTVTVVVADLVGNNLFTVEYRASDFYNIDANGSTVTFICRAGTSAREGYLRDYGILFEYEKQFTVAGLTPTTAVDPREKLTYSFAGENGSIVMTLGLTESSYVVGNYTVNLEVVEEESWWSTYLRLRFTIVDNTTLAEVASGNYTASGYTGLSEGGIVRLNDSFERDAIAMATGLLFSTEEPDIIVSTK